MKDIVPRIKRRRDLTHAITERAQPQSEVNNSTDLSNTKSSFGIRPTSPSQKQIIDIEELDAICKIAFVNEQIQGKN